MIVCKECNGKKFNKDVVKFHRDGFGGVLHIIHGVEIDVCEQCGKEIPTINGIDTIDKFFAKLRKDGLRA